MLANLEQDLPLVSCERFLGGTIEVPASRLKFRPSAYGIITRGEHVLLLTNRLTNKLTLPGGAIELGESIEQALQREVYEECGIKITINKQAFTNSGFFYFDPSQECFHCFLFYYYCTTNSLQVSDRDNVPYDVSTNPTWFPIKNLKAEQFQKDGDSIIKHLTSITSVL